MLLTPRARGHRMVRAPWRAARALLLSVGLLSAAGFATPGAVLQRRPNLVLAFSDDTGWGDPSCYGNPAVVTPGLDQMAAEGMRLTSFYTAAPICSSSRSSLLTGRIPLRTGVWSNKSTRLITFAIDSTGGLALRERTLPQALRSAGYSTGMIGKWHLGQLPQFLPTARGFDEYLGIPYCHNSCPCPADQPTIECYLPPGLPPQGGGLPCPLLNGTAVVQQPIVYANLTSRYVAAATDFIQSRLNNERPFFLYFAFGHTHAWNFASPEYWGFSDRGHYGDSLQEMDAALGELTGQLRPAAAAAAAAGVGSQTLVFWSSDNGAAWPHRFEHAGSTGPFACGKGTVWEGGIRVPAIAWWPGVIKPRTVSMAPLSTLDIFPTFVALGRPAQRRTPELPPPLPVDGVDISSFLRASAEVAAPAPRALFWYFADQLAAVRVGSYKAHYLWQGWSASAVARFPACGPENASVLEPPLLYHINRDPSERFPIDASSEEWRQAMARVRAAVAKQAAALALDGAVALPELDAREDAAGLLCCGGREAKPPFDMCKCGQ